MDLVINQKKEGFSNTINANPKRMILEPGLNRAYFVVTAKILCKTQRRVIKNDWFSVTSLMLTVFLVVISFNSLLKTMNHGEVTKPVDDCDMTHY